MISKIKDSNHLLDIIDNINNMFLLANAILVTSNIVNINSKSGLDAVNSALLKNATNTTPVECILEGLEGFA